MHLSPLPAKPPSESSRNTRLTARAAILATTLTAAALGPGLAVAEARVIFNHNEVLTTSRH